MRGRVVLTSVLAVTLLAGCQQVDDARSAAEDVRAEAEGVLDRVRFCAAAVDLATGLAQQDAARATDAARDLADAAPPELADDVEVVLAAAEVARSGDLTVLRDAEVGAAASRVTDSARAQCDVTGG